MLNSTTLPNTKSKNLMHLLAAVSRLETATNLFSIYYVFNIPEVSPQL